MIPRCSIGGDVFSLVLALIVDSRLFEKNQRLYWKKRVVGGCNYSV